MMRGESNEQMKKLKHKKKIIVLGGGNIEYLKIYKKKLLTVFQEGRNNV